MERRDSFSIKKIEINSKKNYQPFELTINKDSTIVLQFDGFEPQNLSEIIKAGFLKRVETIHRLTIDKASENPIHGRSKAAPKEE